MQSEDTDYIARNLHLSSLECTKSVNKDDLSLYDY